MNKIDESGKARLRAEGSIGTVPIEFVKNGGLMGVDQND